MLSLSSHVFYVSGRPSAIVGFFGCTDADIVRMTTESSGFHIDDDGESWVLYGDILEQESNFVSYDIAVDFEYADTLGATHYSRETVTVTGFRSGAADNVTVRYIENIATRIGTTPVITMHGTGFDPGMGVFLYQGDECRQVSPEDLSWDIDSSGDNRVSFVLSDSLMTHDSSGDEVCGSYEIYIGVGVCGENPVLLAGSNDRHMRHINNLALLRYKYDSANSSLTTTTSAYGTTSACYFASDMEMVYDTVDANGNELANGGAAGKYGKTMYFRPCKDTECGEIQYFRVKLKYNVYLGYIHGEQVLDGVQLLSGDIVWLSAQHDGTDGLWVVQEGDWVGLGDAISEDDPDYDPCSYTPAPLAVDCGVFVDLGVRVRDSVSITASKHITPYGTQFINGAMLHAGDVVALTGQNDGTNGIYQVTCGAWELLGGIGTLVDGSIEQSENVVVQNDIDFCKCGIYHIDYYYLNASCYLTHLRRNVKVLCTTASIAPNAAAKQFVITDYRIMSGADSELLGMETRTAGDPVKESCTTQVIAYVTQYGRGSTETRKCYDGFPIVTPDMRTGCLCETYYTVSFDETYSSSRSGNGFSILFWHLEEDGWHLYAYVADGRLESGMNYYVYHLFTDGIATAEDIDVNTEVETYVGETLDTVRTSDAWFTVHNGVLCDGFSLVDDTWDFAIYDIDGELVGYTHELNASNLYQKWSVRCTTTLLASRDYSDERYEDAMRLDCDAMSDSEQAELAKEYLHGLDGVYGFRYYRTAITKDEFRNVYNGVADPKADSLSGAFITDDGVVIMTDDGQLLVTDEA